MMHSLRDSLEGKENLKNELEQLELFINSIEDVQKKQSSYEIIRPLLEESRYFYAISFRKIFKALNPGKNVQIINIMYEVVPKIFSDSLEIFENKYLSQGTIKDYKHGKYTLAKIVFIETALYITNYIDQEWYKKQSSENRKLMKPPSFYFHKKYFETNRERINARRRENYRNGKGENNPKKFAAVKEYSRKRKLRLL